MTGGAVLTLDAAIAFAEALRRDRKRVVFTNGVFDLLHPGHVRYLRAARAEGDALIVGLNSDASVRAIKGPDRPLTPEAVVFNDETPGEIIRQIQPDVLVKGADWAANAIVGRDTVEARGGRVVRIPVEQGWSTSAIIKKMRVTE